MPPAVIPESPASARLASPGWLDSPVYDGLQSPDWLASPEGRVYVDSPEGKLAGSPLNDERAAAREAAEEEEDDDGSVCWPDGLGGSFNPWYECWLLWLVIGLILLCCSLLAFLLTRGKGKGKPVHFSEVCELDKQTLPWLEDLEASQQQQMQSQPAGYPSPNGGGAQAPLL